MVVSSCAFSIISVLCALLHVGIASIPTNTKTNNADWVSSLGPVFRLVADRGCLPHGGLFRGRRYPYVFAE